MHNRRLLPSLRVVCIFAIFSLLHGGMFLGGAEGDSAEILSLWPVNGATPGAAVKLWAQVKNTGDSACTYSARLWFYVDGPNWSANHWVGSVSLSGLEAGADQWFSLSWTIPSSSPLGNYVYWAQAWTNQAISDWSNAQGFAVTKEGVPGKATLISPNGTITSTSPTYSWTAVSKATSYYLWVIDSAGSTKIQTWYTAQQTGCSSGTGNCSITPTTVLAKGSYLWRIQTKNSIGAGYWSDDMTFTVAGAGPPGKATLISPNGTISSSSPAYTWAAVSKSTSYYLWVVDSTGSAKIQTWYTAQQVGCNSGTGNCTVTPTTKLATGSCQWWIQTQNAEGYGPWSDGMVFTVAAATPGKATLISPNGTISSSSPAYTWAAVPKATSYYLWVADSAGTPKIQTWYTAQQMGCSSGSGNCSITPATALVAGSYQWWIQTKNTEGEGPWSDGMSFTIGSAGPPGKATLISPNGTISSATPTYTWSAVQKSASYYLWVTDSTGTAKIQTWYTAQQTGCSSGTGNCSIAPATTLAAGSYQWWIQTRNTEGDGPWSDGMSFTLAGAGPPGKAALVSPTGTVTTTTPTYIWNALATATGYTLLVNDSKTSGKINQSLKASDIGCSSGTGICCYKPATALAAGNCQWTVQAFNDYGSGPWSDEMSFVVAGGPYGIEFLTVPAGDFDMGSTNGNSDETPIHRVVISKSFQLGIYEITQGQWKAVMGSNPSNFSGNDNLPVESVSWEDIQPFLAKLNALKDGYKYRLPTEAEWEYSCRAGTTGDHAGNLGEMAWYSANSGGKTHEIGTKKPNAWGLYDMHGNVEEWTQDWYDSIYYWSSPQTDPQGPASGLHRVSRGGGWNSVAFGARSAYRGEYYPGIAIYSLGFRLVRTPQ
jgi:formylglycine-generating enzyme required for sulfatase activity